MKTKKERFNEKQELCFNNAMLNYARIEKPDENGVYSVKITADGDCSAQRALLWDFVNKVAAYYDIAPEMIDVAGEHSNNVFSINAKTQFPPKIVYREGKVETTEIYSGCVASAIVSAYSYVYMGRVGVSYYLQAICKEAEGERLDSGVNLAVFGDGIAER